MPKNKLYPISLLILLITGVSGCSTYDYQKTNGVYNREAICDKLGKQLKYYDNPSYASKHPISEDKLGEMINTYHANGCDK